MDMVPNGKRPPKSLSKQQSCSQLSLHSSGKLDSRFNRGCLTPNPKMTSHRNLQRSDSTTCKNELKRPLKFGSTDRVRSASRKTPKSGKSGASIENTPRSTPAGTRGKIGSSAGKTKRDFDQEKEIMRPKKKLAIAYDDANEKNEEQRHRGVTVLENKGHMTNNLIPIAEVKPLTVARNLNETYDIIDGISNATFNIEQDSIVSEPLPVNRTHQSFNQEDQTNNHDMATIGDFSVNVAVRIRPFTTREEQDKYVHCALEVIEDSIYINENNGNCHSFTYDMAFWSFNKEDPSYASQEKVYALSAQPLLNWVLKGYNTCLFAYGQTGSGKSYTMTGYEGEDAGVISRFCKDLFQRIQLNQITCYSMEISFFEIYNERIRDLLSYSQDTTRQLRIREHPEQGPYVQDLSIFTVTSWEDIEGWLAVGNKNRATAATGMNDRSSRSHSVFTILLSQLETEVYEGTETQITRTSKVNLIDLAGSERANQVINDVIATDHETVSCRLKEGSCINRSLHTLGKVISLLSEKQTEAKKKIFIPYRESTLTWLLKESLGGNSRTSMIATVSPANIHLAETLSTLRYARQARNIINQARVNEDANAKMIRGLLREIDRLKSIKSSQGSESLEPVKEEVEILKVKLVEANSKLLEATRKWENKLKLSEARWKEETEKIKLSGLASHIDHSLPSLVNLNEDPMLSEILVYILKDGRTTFGNASSQDIPDIQLNGPLVADLHCFITNENKDVKISPFGDSPVYVNGEQISTSIALKHGDRIVIGGTHFFRFNHPSTCVKENEKESKNQIQMLKRKPSKRELRKKWDGLTLKDFEFAKRELSQQQNAKLEAEMEDSQMKAQEGLIELITNAKETAEKQLSLQRDAYKDEISELQRRLEDAECKRRIAEKNQNMAEDRLIQLKSHKQALEEEIQNNRRRLQEEATAARQAFEETRASQLKIITELEAEKQKIEDDVKNIKDRKLQRNLVRNEIRSAMSSATREKPSDKKDLLKIALLLREANKISEKLRKNITFSRDDILENEQVEIRIRLNDTKNGRTTLWSLEKFEIMVGKMRDLYQANGRLEDGEEDPFYESIDEWMDDFVLDSPSMPEPSLNSSGMSFGRRQSLNHSLHLLTNLNASLSELSKRRKSSAVFRGIPESAEQQETMMTLSSFYERLETEPFLEHGNSICTRILVLLQKINDEILLFQDTTVKASRHSSQAFNVAVLLTRLKECSKTWGEMQSIVTDCEMIKNQLTSLDTYISKFISECKMIFQPVPHLQRIERIKDSLMTIVSCVGGLSLTAVDCIHGQSNDFVCPMKEPTFSRSFVKGQQELWFEFIKIWSNEADILLRTLRDLQLAHKNEIELDLDHLVNLVNSSLTMFANMKEFLAFIFENLPEENRSILISEKIVNIQRNLIGICIRHTKMLKNIICKARTARTNDSDLKSIHDDLHIVMICCGRTKNLFADLVNESKSALETDACSVNGHILENFERLQFAAKAVQVGVAVISQGLNELYFPDGRYSMCLEGKENETANEIIITPFLMQHDN